DHCIFGRCLGPTLGLRSVNTLKVEQFLLVKSCEIAAVARPQIATRALHPEDFDVLPREWIDLGAFGRRVTHASVGDSLVAPENVRTIDQALNGVELIGLGVVPKVIDVTELSGCGHFCTFTCGARSDSGIFQHKHRITQTAPRAKPSLEINARDRPPSP